MHNFCFIVHIIIYSLFHSVFIFIILNRKTNYFYGELLQCSSRTVKITNQSILPLPTDTSRTMRELEEDGKAYHFTTREVMEEDIKNHKYLEYGELNSNLYGTKIDSILSVIRSGKMCILDCSPAVSSCITYVSQYLSLIII